MLLRLIPVMRAQSVFCATARAACGVAGGSRGILDAHHCESSYGFGCVFDPGGCLNPSVVDFPIQVRLGL